MIEQELTYQDLRILSSEIYEAMGYKDSIPDQMVIDETNTLLKRITPLLRPRFAFFFMEGTLDIEKETLSVQSIHPPTVNPIQDTIPTRSPKQNTFSTQSKSTVFSVGKTIARQLRGSEAFVFFAATAGTEFEVFQHTLQQEEDMVKIYIADSLGSIIAEKTADCMEVALAEYIREKNWKHTNRYTVTFAPAYALPLLSASSGTITCPVIVTVPLSPVAVLSADALILPNGIFVAIINAIINHAAILFPFVLQNISIF